MTDRIDPLIQRLDVIADEAEEWLEELRVVIEQLREDAGDGQPEGPAGA